MNNWRESRFKAVCRVFSFCCGPTGPLVVIKGRMAVCGDAWSRTTLALISYAFCALSVPRPASPFVKATFTGSLNILSNTNMVKVKDEKIFPSHAWVLRVLLLKQTKKICNHNPISVIPRQAVCRRSAGVWQTTQTDAHQCATAPRLQPLSR